jgi:hypothetical protein
MRRQSNALVAVVATLVVTGQGCMGKFALTRGLYGWNETVTDNKVVNQLVFWALGILPVYSLAMTGDLLIFNVIEFWTGKNVFADSATSPEGTSVASIVRDGETFAAARRADGRVVVTRDGVVIGSVEALPTGGLAVFDARDVETSVLTPDEVRALAPTVAQLHR